jgi:hypothetical protein
VLGRAAAQAVSRRLSTAAARVRAQVRSCGICGGQSGTGAGFLRVLRFPLPIIRPTPTLIIIIIYHHPGVVQQASCSLSNSGLCSTPLPPPQKGKKKGDWVFLIRPSPGNRKLHSSIILAIATLHADLGISYVHEVIHQKCNKHHTRLGTHENPLLKTLLLREENKRLKRNWPIDLI